MILPVILLLAVVGSIFGAMVFAERAIITPMLALAGVMQRLTAGDVTITVPHVGRKDEISAMATALEIFRDNMAKIRGLEQERAAAAARLARAQSMEALKAAGMSCS